MPTLVTEQSVELVENVTTLPEFALALVALTVPVPFTTTVGVLPDVSVCAACAIVTVYDCAPVQLCGSVAVAVNV